MNSGIYVIKNKNNGKLYVGSSCNLKNRFSQHLNLLQSNKHNAKLQNSFNKHGEKLFSFEVIEYVEGKQLLIEREQYWINTLDTFKLGYNMSPTAGSTKGFRGHKHSRESKLKMSLCKIGNLHNKGSVYSEEHRRNISNSLKGIPKIKASFGMLGKIHSSETKIKMKQSQQQRRLRDSKLTEEQALEILNQTPYYGYIANFSRKFGVSVDIIKSVIDRRTFKHLVIGLQQ